MILANTLRYMDTGAGGAWNQRYYIMNDYMLLAQKYGVGMISVMTEQAIEDVCHHCDGLLVPGSGTDIKPSYYGSDLKLPKEPEVDEYALDSKLIRYFYEAGKPIFGICGGHQELNIFFGGTIKTLDDYDSHQENTTKTHPINVVKDSFVYEVFQSERPTTNSYHRWEIGRLAPDLKIVASTDDGVAEAIEWKEKNIFATQWHPEQSFHTGDPLENQFFVNFLRRCEACR